MRALSSTLTHHRTNRHDSRKPLFLESFSGQKLVVSRRALRFLCLHRHASQKYPDHPSLRKNGALFLVWVWVGCWPRMWSTDLVFAGCAVDSSARSWRGTVFCRVSWRNPGQVFPGLKIQHQILSSSPSAPHRGHNTATSLISLCRTPHP